MVLIDTNAVIRVITNDIPELADQAIAFIADSKKGSVLLTDSVLTELCFVLEFHEYKMERRKVCQAISDFVSLSAIVIDDVSMKAVQLYGENPKLDYTDCYLLSSSDTTTIFTLDKKLQKAINEKRR